MLRVLTCLVRPLDLTGRLGGGLRRFVEVAARIHRCGVKYLIVESEPFLRSFGYFTRMNEVAANHSVISFHVPWEAAVNRRVLGPIVFWLKLLMVTFVAVRTARSSRAQLILAPGETLPEVIVAWTCAKLTTRPAVVVAQSDPFLHIGTYQMKGVRSAYAALRTLYNPLTAFVEALTAQLHIRALNDMTLLIVGRSLFEVLRGRGITGITALAVENGVDFEMIDVAPQSQLHADAVYVGRVDISKGMKELLHAWAQLGKTRSELRLAVVGPVQEGLRERIETVTSSSGGRISYLGALSDAGVISVLKSCRVLVLPSIFESFSLVAAEALACSIPVISYDSPGVREFFPTSAVKIVPAGDAAGLVSAVKELLENNDELLRLGKIGREFVSRYSWEKVAREEAAIYRQLVERKFADG